MKKENKTWKTKKLLLHYFSETVDFSPGEVIADARAELTNEEDPPEYNCAVVPAITILGFDDRVDLIDNIVIKNCVIRKTEEQGQNILINNFNGVTIENLKVK